MNKLYNPLRYWCDQPCGFPTIDQVDAEADREDSLSERYAFQLGEDLGLCRMEPPPQWPSHEMERGYLHGQKRVAKHADIYLRKLLRLRVNAYARNLPFSTAITTDYLRQITVTVCPVSGGLLTQGTMTDTDWSVDRLDNGLGYVPGNICFLSARVNRLKGTADVNELLADGAANALMGGQSALIQRTQSGLYALEVLRLVSMMVAPASIARSLCMSEFPPLAMAPGVWVTPLCQIAGLHVACARSRSETRAARLRSAWIKCISAACWRISNRLVERIRTQLSAGVHPSDLWLDLECASLILEIMDALSQNPPPLPSSIQPEAALELVNAQFKAVSAYSR
jgi:hypothetical protein